MTAAIFVTYYPDRDLLMSAISSIYDQVETVIVVSNSTADNDRWVTDLFSEIIFVPLGTNVGIAAAQNVGINCAIEKNHEFVILSDQDTVYPPNYVGDLLKVIQQGTGKKIAAVVPAFFDAIKGDLEGYIPEDTIFFTRKKTKNGCVDVHQAIASGMLMPTGVLEEVGLLDEQLFIDWVDIEWCWRAKAAGYKIVMQSDTVVQHALGDRARDLGYRKVNIRSPIRHYYITRNAFHLALWDTSLSDTMRLVLFLRSLRYLVAFPLIGKPHGENFKMVSKAFFDALRGRLGKINF